MRDETEKLSEKTYHRRILGWSMYDWADHGVITTSIVTFFPPYFIAIAAPAFLEAGKLASDKAAMTLANDTASNVFAITLSIALFLSALIAPIVGTYADILGQRKRLLIVVTGLGGVIASMMFTLTTGMWLVGLGLYAATQITMNIGLGLNSGLLPFVSKPNDLDRVSTLAYALGFVGGSILLALNTALFAFSDQLHIDPGLAVRIAFLSTGIWWILFTIPLALLVPEPPALAIAEGEKHHENNLRRTFARINHTIRDIQRYRELFKMLIAFWMYSEGVTAIILLATAFGKTLGLDNTSLVSTILLTQIVGLPYVLIFGRIPSPSSQWRSAYISMLIWTAVTLPIIGLYANLNGQVGIGLTFALLFGDQLLGIAFSYFIGRHVFAGVAATFNTKRAVLFGLTIFLIIPFWGLFLHTTAEFYMIGWLAGTAQGGIQALSRTIYARLTPRAKSGEFFGLYGLSEKFAGVLGPLLYGVIGTITHSPQASILSVAVFFLIGMALLGRVNEREGEQIATAEDTAYAEGIA